MTMTLHPVADAYLRELDRAAQAIPRRERAELVSEIRAHLDQALPAEATEAEVRNVLDDLGLPADIVAAARPARPVYSDGAGSAPRRGVREGFALALLVTGFPPVLGWLVGAVLLVVSPLWTGRQKLLGLLVWPGGLVMTVLPLSVISVRGGAASCIESVGPSGVPVGCSDAASGGLNWLAVVAMVLVVVLPVLVAAYLWRAAGKAEAAAA
jgi:hypothetical protein